MFRWIWWGEWGWLWYVSLVHKIVKYKFNLFNLCFIDLAIDISKIGTEQANELNSTAHGFGMITNDFYSFLNNDLEEAENIQMARLAEEEKAMFAVCYFFFFY